MRNIFLILILFCSIAANAQNLPVYGNLVPSDSGALDLGRNNLRWDTIFVDAIYPPVAGSGIWEETNDSTIRWSFGGDTVFFYINNGVVRLGSDAALYFGVKGNNAYIFNGTTSTAAELRLNEDADNGTNYVSWKSPALLGGNVTLTLPDNDGNANEVLATNGSGTLSFTPKLWATDGGSDVFLVDSTDEVGIGTSQPAFQLHVKGTNTVQMENPDGTDFFAFYSGALQMFLEGGSADESSSLIMNGADFEIKQLGSELRLEGDTGITLTTDSFILLTAQKVGIGTDAPTYKLSVVADDSVFAALADSGGITFDGTQFLLSGSGTTAKFDVSLTDGTAPDIQFNVNPTTGIVTTKEINTTAGDAATVDAPVGRFRKDASGTSFTLTNSFITANSILIPYIITPALTAGNNVKCVAGAGSAVCTFENAAGAAEAPNANADVNFIVIN